jgi:predicted nucleic-acid-binding Zn-ribbon protein
METPTTCAKCGGAVIETEASAGGGQLVGEQAAERPIAGIVRGSLLKARVCTQCGNAELYATNPEVLK